MRYGIMGGWRMNQKKADINFAVQYLTTFMPELIREVKTSSAELQEEALLRVNWLVLQTHP